MEASAVTKAPPDAYERHVGRYGRELAAGMLGVALLRRGRRALDVGCGPGPLTSALASLLGPENVAAVDPSEAFAARCRERVPGIDVRLGKAEELPFDDDEFDAALAQLVVDGMEDARRGVAEMRRVTRPRGVVAACVWDWDGGMPLLNTMWEAARAFDPERARSFGAAAPRPFSRADDIEELWRATGFEDVQRAGLVAGAAYDGIDDLFAPFQAGVGDMGKLVLSLDESARARFKEEVFERFGRPSGPFRLTARALAFRGRVPVP